MAAKYSDYELVVGADWPDARVHFADAPNVPGRMMRVTLDAYRIPSLKRFEIHYFADATADDRDETVESIAPLFASVGASYTRRWRLKSGQIVFALRIGDLVDDPFAQLELEMMIDNSTSDNSIASAIHDGSKEMR